jgi:hypothetical protein
MFFNSQMKAYFLDGMNEIFKVKKSDRWTSRLSLRSAAPLRAAETDAAYSPIDTICATMCDFFVFIGEHLFSEDLETLIFICMKKVVLRYVIFLRDVLISTKIGRKKRFFRKKKGKQQPGGVDGGVQNTSTLMMGNQSTMTPIEGNEGEPEDEESETSSIPDSVSNTGAVLRVDVNSTISRIRADVRCILRLYSKTILKLREQNKAAGDGEAVADELEDPHHGSEHGLSDLMEEHDGKHDAYERATSSILTLLSNLSMAVIAGEIDDPAAIERIIKSQCFLTVDLLYSLFV